MKWRESHANCDWLGPYMFDSWVSKWRRSAARRLRVQHERAGLRHRLCPAFHSANSSLSSEREGERENLRCLWGARGKEDESRWPPETNDWLPSCPGRSLLSVQLLLMCWENSHRQRAPIRTVQAPPHLAISPPPPPPLAAKKRANNPQGLSDSSNIQSGFVCTDRQVDPNRAVPLQKCTKNETSGR